MATVAETLHHAHKQGLVHCDIKPGNILLDRSGKPFVGDFGLALREQDMGKGPRYAGTPAYTSPEQARGEGHRVDGRSDIFSLGVVFYELLAGRQPFRAEFQAEMLDQVATHEPRPLRQMDEGIPFEQWLHAKKEEQDTELVQALRQCDDERVQCVVMVRDDFWMAATRFMRDLEVRLVEAHNSAAVDLFPIRHAEKVLTAFGRAFGALPESAELPSDATQFALLPETGSDIKGHMRSYAELLEASGCGSRPQDFDDLLRILDNEVRLITPTDPEGMDEASGAASARRSDTQTPAEPDTGGLTPRRSPDRYYQLTHDYLVPSLRDWLTRKQKETRRGRAELLLADRAAVWTARPENRQLPSLLQWFQIRWHTGRKNWTPPQKKMMAKAGRYHAGRAATLAVVLALLTWGGYETHGTIKAQALRDRLLDANTADVPASDDKRETLAKRQANAAVALLRLNQPAKIWPLLKHSPDPRARSYLIHRLFPLGADSAAIIQRFHAEPDLSARRALLLALGEFDEATLPAASRAALLPKVQAIYQKEPDPGLHASAEWLLRKWGQEAWLKQVNEEWAEASREASAPGVFPAKAPVADAPGSPKVPQWYVNTQGQTFVVVPGPVEFVMGSPKTEKDWEEREVAHKRRIGRSFAIASKSVTLAQYRSLTKDKHEIGEKYTYDPNLPVVGISWYMAAQYCNLLSKEEGISEDQWCCEIKGEPGGVSPRSTYKLKENYLSLTGYRLPTEAEMEYATRAGAATSRYYGETEELLGHYAWYTKSSNDVLKPVGQKQPNDLGLFDAQGNCYTWCQQAYGEYPLAKGDEAVEDKDDELVVNSTHSRVLRGGSFGRQASIVRSASRVYLMPTVRNVLNGFRPARTLRR